MAGGAVLVALGLSGRLAQMARVFTPNVVGVILLLIAFTLLPHLVPRLAGVDEVHPGGEPAILATSLALVVAMAILSRWLRGFWQTVALFLGILLGTLVFALLGRVEWRPVVTAPWAAWPEQWWQQPPRFAWPAVTAFTMAYLAVVANSLGSIQGIANLTDVSRLPAGINRGILMNGLAGICSGLAGVVGMVSYSMSPGVVLVTRVASRYSITACGMTLALAAFLPKLAALLALVPAPVVGAALCVGLAGQVGAGLAILTSHQRTLAARDYLVVGIPVMVGTLVGMLPQGLVAAMPVTARVFLGNGLIVGMLIVLLMEHVLLRPNS
jgi:uracil permease